MGISNLTLGLNLEEVIRDSSKQFTLMHTPHSLSMQNNRFSIQYSKPHNSIELMLDLVSPIYFEGYIVDKPRSFQAVTDTITVVNSQGHIVEEYDRELLQNPLDNSTPQTRLISRLIEYSNEKKQIGDPKLFSWADSVLQISMQKASFESIYRDHFNPKYSIPERVKEWYQSVLQKKKS